MPEQGSQPGTEQIADRGVRLAVVGQVLDERDVDQVDIDSPSVATTRPLAIAASMICWMRWMWLAKLAVITRRRGTHLDGFAMACSG